MKGRLVVVGGHSRHVGKTSMMNIICGAAPEMNWHAVKISSHRHSGRPASTVAGVPNLLRLSDEEMTAGAAHLAALRAAGRNLAVESNRIVSHLDPDLVIFVVAPLIADWKESSAACLQRADALVFSGEGPTPLPLATLGAPLPTFRLREWLQPPEGFSAWLRQRLALPMVHGGVSARTAASCSY